MHSPDHAKPIEQRPPLNESLHQAGQLLVAAETTEQSTDVERYRVFTNPNERMEYMHFTDDLIVTLDGTVDPEGKPYDAVVYLDSSARPVTWMVNALWDFAARKDDDGKPVKRPATFFANIDARRTGRNMDKERAQALHDTYPQLAEWNDRETPGKVLIVDEIAVSGDTLRTARSHFQSAFPNLKFGSYAWKNEQGVPDINRDNVRWYERGNDRYRAVLDPNEITDKQREALEERKITPKPGWLAVPNPDRTGADMVREEVKRMTDELMAGKMPYWPSLKRPLEQTEELVAEYDGGLGLKQFTIFREWMKRHYSPSPIANAITTDDNGPLSRKEVFGYLKDHQRLGPEPVLDDATAEYLQKLGYL